MQTYEKEIRTSNINLKKRNRIVIYNKKPFDSDYQKTKVGIFLLMGTKSSKQVPVTGKTEVL